MRENGVDVTSIDISKQPPTEAELEAMLAVYDGDIGKLFNRSGVRYRELKLKDSLPTMSSQQAIKLLAGDGKLIKRPFLITDHGQGVVGFKADAWQEFV
ncbi:arsenate reductase [Arenicella xantha]|uniref:Arsenate reductase n=1 Tax=Arenicella xantha TaxID=644221 RepID=A0A395JQ17_9GAMM|nr:arsenate reductase [Arenicella xantha]